MGVPAAFFGYGRLMAVVCGRGGKNGIYGSEGNDVFFDRGWMV